MSAQVTRSLYRSLQRRARRIDQSPVAKCFVVAKPRAIYLHEIDDTVPLKLVGDEYAVESFLREHNGGQFYVPALPDTPNQPKNNEYIPLTTRIQKIFRDGLPPEFETKLAENGQKMTDIRKLQLGFMMFRRLSLFARLADQAHKKAKSESLSAATRAASSSSPPIPSSLSADSPPSASIDSPNLIMLQQQQLTEALPKLSLSSLGSVPISAIRDGDLDLHPGLILVAHPLSCFGQSSLRGRVIFLTEIDGGGVQGLVLNNALRQSRPKSRLGEYSYLGGPVQDETMYIFHNSTDCATEFKQQTETMVLPDESKGIDTAVFLTEVGSEKRSHLDKFWRRMKSDDGNTTGTVAGAVLPSPTEMDPYAHATANPTPSSSSSTTTRTEDSSTYKFIYQSATWDIRQLRCEIENGVWFVCYVSDAKELSDLLLSTVPEFRGIGSILSKDHAESKSLHDGSDVELDDTKEEASGGPKMRTRGQLKVASRDHGVTATLLTQAYNAGMWKEFMKGLGGEHAELADFPTFDDKLAKEYEEFLNKFYRGVFEDAIRTAMS